MTLRTLVLALVPALLAGCGSDSFPTTVSYSISLDPSDVSGTSISDDQDIRDDDRQWSAFVAGATGDLGGSPGEFEVKAARLWLQPEESRGVVRRLEDVLSGSGALYLRSEETGAQVDIATFEDLRGTSQVEVDLTDNDLGSVNPALLGSTFRLGLRSGTPLSAGSDFRAVLVVTLDVEAR